MGGVLIKYNDDAILMPDTNVWGDYWVSTEAFKYESRKKKSKGVFDPTKIVDLLNCFIDRKMVIIPNIVGMEIHGVIKHKFSKNKSLNLGKNKKKILESALKKAEKMHHMFQPTSIDHTRNSYERAMAAYKYIRNDCTPEMLEKKTRWARQKHRKKWEELGILKKTQPPYDDETKPKYKDIKILASAVEAAREKRAALITRDHDFTIFSEIGRELPVDVIDAYSLK
ncbi:MAG: hypothetical protein D9C04_06075 [Nitrosopumilus sp. B06]|nr:MAG: hypothetical protein D9C04_06075 [Nitrosopumilus sp. B06]